MLALVDIDETTADERQPANCLGDAEFEAD